MQKEAWSTAITKDRDCISYRDNHFFTLTKILYYPFFVAIHFVDR